MIARGNKGLVPLLRLAWPKHTRKRMATRFGIAVDTAKHWLQFGVPPGRRAEVSEALIAELDLVEREIGRARRRLERMAGPQDERPVVMPLRLRA